MFDFGAGPLTRNELGEVVHGEVIAGDGVIWLHPVSARYRLQSPRTLGAATAMTAVMVDDVDAHYADVVARGARVVEPPVDQPYGVRECTVEGVGARNCVVPGQAAFLYSLMSPSHRVDLMTRSWAGSRPVLDCGSCPSGGRWSRARCGR